MYTCMYACIQNLQKYLYKLAIHGNLETCIHVCLYTCMFANMRNSQKYFNDHTQKFGHMNSNTLFISEAAHTTGFLY